MYVELLSRVGVVPKWTVDKVVEILPEGYVLTSCPVRFNTATPLHVRCDQGHDWKTFRVGNFLRGAKCPTCAGNEKLTPEMFEQRINALGYRLLSSFEGVQNKVTVACSVCSKSKTVFAYTIKQRCIFCKTENKTLAMAASIREKAIKEIASRGLELQLEDVFLKGKSYFLRFTKPGGKQVECRASSFFIKKQKIGSKRLDFSDFRHSYESGGYVILDDQKYVNNSTKYDVKCPVGHIFQSTRNLWTNGHRCPDCGGTKKLTPDQVQDRIIKSGYQWLSGSYEHVHSPLQLQCKEHGPFIKSVRQIYDGGCPSCNIASKGEIELCKKLWKENFWSQSYCLISVGGAPIEVLKRYIEQQSGHEEIL
jgi:hypothetical protein